MKLNLKSLLFFACLLPLLAMDLKKQEVFSLHENEVMVPDSSREAKFDSLIAFAKKYLKKPYCYGSRPPKCFDCSGFVQFCFAHFGTELPHSSQSSAFLGKFVSWDHARKGDLIFFTGRNHETETVGHVGIITEIIDTKIYFIHASVQSGVVISCSDEEYYKKRFMMIKRFKI